MVRRCRWVTAVVLGLTMAVVSAGWAQPNSSAIHTYVLGPGDVIEIFMRGHDDLSRTVTIRLDGSITLPLVGPVVAAGMTLPQLQARLLQLYRTYLKSPEVTITIVQFRRIQIAVLGQVLSPGARELPVGSTLLDAITAAGGLAAGAGAAQSYLIRDSRQVIPLDIPQVLGGDVRANLVLQDRDVIVVPDAGRIYVLGEVARPGAYRLNLQPTLLDVLLEAGGLTERASIAEARLLRRGRDPVPINLEALLTRADISQNVTLEPGDILVIPEDPQREIRVYVLGEVNSPGGFSVKSARTVLQAVTLAGGPTAKASLRDAYLIRRTAAGQARGGQIIPLDLEALIRRGDLSKDIPLREGDIIYIPERFLTAASTYLQAIVAVLSGLASLGSIFR